ncbi:MAG: peptidylprolyl isomerase [Saprospiraceae bacterium]|nr:peptidylprolyl isomerase [Saprospiraceae bacterium]
MGIITGIRKRGVLMIVLIGVATGGFIVMDVVQNQNRSAAAGKVGVVDGVSLDFNEVRNMEEILYQGSNADEYSKREYIWNYFVDNTIATNEAEKVGIMVGKNELLDLEFGSNVSPLIQQRFANPQTGKVDMQQMLNIKEQIKKGELQPQMRAFWAIQEKEIIKDRLVSKLNSLFTKAVYTPTWQAEQVLADQANPITALYVKVPATYIGDSEIKLTDSDFQNYIDEHKSVYKNDKESRIISTVNISVSTSKEDTIAAEQSIKEKLEDFKNATNDSTFVLANNGSISDVYHKPAQLDVTIKDKITTIPVGGVYGPYIQDQKVKAVKLLGKMAIADSVKSRHILIPASTPEEFAKAEKRIDSAQAVILSGKASFADVAKAISKDPGSASKGGELPYAPQGMMVKPFNDALFFDSKPGQLKKVKTQFGYHLIEILDKKTVSDPYGYKVAYIFTDLVPSEATQNKTLARVESILQGVTNVEQLNEKLKSNPGLQLVKNFAVDKSDFALQTIAPGQSARDIIKWAFEPNRKAGDVATEPFPVQADGKYYVEQYVIPVLTTILHEGNGRVEDLKEELTPMVMTARKVTKLFERAKAIKSMDALASQFNAKIDTAKNVVFNSGMIPGIGREPKVLAEIFSLPLNQTSGVFKGQNGIFMVKPVSQNPSPMKPTVENIKKFNTGTIVQTYNGRVMDALKKKASIEDNRGDLY